MFVKKRLEDVLLESGKITSQQINEGLQYAHEKRMSLSSAILQRGYISENDLFKLLAEFYKIPYINLSTTTVQTEAIEKVPEKLARKYSIVPLSVDHGRLLVAMENPSDHTAINELRWACKLEVVVKGIAPRQSVQEMIDRAYGDHRAKQFADELSRDLVDLSFRSPDGLSGMEISSAPVVRLIDLILEQAKKMRASDIHIEPTSEQMKVRFRIDGQLKEILSLGMSVHPAIITRLKIIGQMDIAEKRIPQDGGYKITIEGESIDLRFSLMPSIYGEKAVIRFLGGSAVSLNRKDLGLSEKNLVRYETIAKNPNGIILVSGPTGSGKTTTLYSLLTELNEPTVNIITVEDPVEYKLSGITQVQVNQKAGLTFANGLRAILRQDPDIIMIGEIRDSETAEIAIRAAITGHLVLSTIHTIDSASSVVRLIDMGIEPFLVSASVVGVIAQRLVRTICPQCKQEYMPSDSEMLLLKMNEPRKLMKGIGCGNCNSTGYLGRHPIFEILIVTREIREMVNRGATTDEIKTKVREQGMITLQEDCAQLVMEGHTTTEELLRVTYEMK